MSRPTAAARKRSRFRNRWRRDRGAGAAETVVAVALLVLLLLLIVQFALAAHAQHIAQTAASRALSEARAQGGSAAAGEARARAVLATLASEVLLHPRVSVIRDGQHVTAQVGGAVQEVVPGVHLSVSGRASGPVERWTVGGAR